LARTGLTGLERKLYGKLSGGQKQRLHLSLALCGDPDLLFLDEPTTGLDVSSRRGLWEGVRSFIAEGKSVLLTTHYLEEADALADRIVVLNHGRIVAEGTPAEVKARTAGGVSAA
jgi:ABC-2 type transport system ATP-binding protein